MNDYIVELPSEPAQPLVCLCRVLLLEQINPPDSGLVQPGWRSGPLIPFLGRSLLGQTKKQLPCRVQYVPYNSLIICSPNLQLFQVKIKITQDKHFQLRNEARFLDEAMFSIYCITPFQQSSCVFLVRSQVQTNENLIFPSTS